MFIIVSGFQRMSDQRFHESDKAYVYPVEQICREREREAVNTV